MNSENNTNNEMQFDGIHKIVTVERYDIEVIFVEHLIQIQNDNAFTSLMQGVPRKGVVELSENIKRIYKECFDKDLMIDNKSLTLEIWGHYYFELFFARFKFIFKHIGLKSIKRRFVEATKVFDCGEKPIDKNRWIWDLLVSLYPSIQYFIKDKK